MIYEMLGDSDVLKDLFILERAEGHLTISEDMPDKENRFRMAVSTAGMFGKKPVRLSGYDSWKKEERVEIEKLLPLFQDEIDVFIDGEVNSKVKSEKKVFGLPKPWEEEKWNDHIIRISEYAGMKISRATAESLLRKVGRREYRLLRELEKLSVVSNEIDELTVERLIDFDKEIEVESLAFDFLSRKEGFLGSSRKSMIPFAYFSSVLLKIIIDLGTIIEKKKGKMNISWSEIKKLSNTIGIGTARIARLVGYSFSNTIEQRIDLTRVYSIERLNRLINLLQEIDESIKNGKVDSEIAYFRLEEESSKLQVTLG
ncbi:MAG: DNA polymerase III subunit delta [Kosmotogaceae bacterium]|nr:DNA polymerase III subunit delta [Kosmotogaceae bacterium]